MLLKEIMEIDGRVFPTRQNISPVIGSLKQRNILTEDFNYLPPTLRLEKVKIVLHKFVEMCTIWCQMEFGRNRRRNSFNFKHVKCDPSASN